MSNVHKQVSFRTYCGNLVSTVGNPVRSNSSSKLVSAVSNSRSVTSIFVGTLVRISDDCILGTVASGLTGGVL